MPHDTSDPMAATPDSGTSKSDSVEETPTPRVIERTRAALREIYGGGRNWIVAKDVLVSSCSTANALRELGAGRILCIGATRGTGDVGVGENDPEPVDLGVDADSMLGLIHRAADALADLPPAVIDHIDDFDPECEARVIGAPFDDGRRVAGRRKWAERATAWQKLEDKTVIDPMWDALDVERAPSHVVPARLAELERAAADLDTGDGTVWVADASEGMHGGGERLRWVRSDAEAEAAAAFLAQHAERVRVMPFLEGIPCSIHGMVFPDDAHVLTLRPCEMLVFRRPGSSRLHYGRAATFWDPAPEDRAHMRSIARRVGGHLRDVYAYRGVFTVDGIMTRQGFRPTELNPRFGAAMTLLGGDLDLNWRLLDLAVAEGVDFDWQPAELEAAWLSASDATRRGSACATLTDVDIAETTKLELVVDGATGAIREAREGEPPHAKLRLGPFAAGGYLAIGMVSEHVPVGPSVAPHAIRLLQWADARFDLGIGPLAPARAVR